MKSTTLALAAAFALALPAHAQAPAPQPLAPAAPIPAPRDVAYAPGTVKLEVDATDIERRIFRVRQTIPVAGDGPVTLLYPQWLPGHHGPAGQLRNLAGLTMHAGGQSLAWSRHPTEAFAFQVTPPPGATAIEVEFQFVSPTQPDQGRVVMTPELLNAQWVSLLLYPAGHFARKIPVEAQIRLPVGWSYATALETASTAGGVIRFKPVMLDVLADSPVMAGRWSKTWELDSGGRSPVRLNVFADRPELLAASPEQIERHRELVRQADRLFGARHFDRYDFLLGLSERLGGIGLEHHRSSENVTDPEYFTDWASGAPGRSLLPHEYSHSWNGKYRRPADLWTPNYNTPMRDSLLWVYEGQDQYWGNVLAARSGLVSREQALDALAVTAAQYSDGRPGRRWRDVEDTTNDPIIAARRPIPWVSWQRSEDYYAEGQLVWLEADALIRERTGGRKSLDDFARAFFGVNDGAWDTELTYTFDDVVAALNAVVPYGWAEFLDTRVRQVAPAYPLGGLTRAGWRLGWSETPSGYWRDSEANRKVADHTYSVGLTVNREGQVTAVLWDGPAFKAGVAVGDRIVAVNGIAYDGTLLREAITAAKGAGPAVSLIVRSADHYRTVALDYHGGLRYPRLERIEGAPDLLTAILAPKR